MVKGNIHSWQKAQQCVMSIYVKFASWWTGNFDVCVCVILGRVIDGLLVLRKIENIPTGPNNKPKIPVTISQCGEM